MLETNKWIIFHIYHIPKKYMGPIHTLILQLLVKIILTLGVSDMTKNSKNEMTVQHFTLAFPNATDELADLMPAYYINDLWSGMNYL